MNILFCNILLLLSQEVDANKGKTAPPSHNTLPALNGANAGTTDTKPPPVQTDTKPSPDTDAKNTSVKDNKGSDPNKNTVDLNKDNDGKTDTKPADTKTKPPAGPDSKPQAGDSNTPPADPNKTTVSSDTKPPASRESTPNNNANT